MDNKLIFLKDTFKDLNLSGLKYKDKDFELEFEREVENKKEVIKNNDIKIINSDNKNTKTDFSKEESIIEKNYYKVKSPLVGLFYSKPAPEEESYVAIGEEVKKGEVLCVLEAMKMFNEVKSPINGVIKSINFKDEDLVSVDDVLFEIEQEDV